MNKAFWQQYGLAMVLATLVQGGVFALFFTSVSFAKTPDEFELPEFIQAKMVVLPKKMADEAKVKATPVPKATQPPKEKKPPKATPVPKTNTQTEQAKANVEKNTDNQAEIAADKPKPTAKPTARPTKKPTPKPTVKPTPRPTPIIKPETDVADILDILNDPAPTQAKAENIATVGDEDVGSYVDGIRQEIEFNWRFPPGIYDDRAVVKVEVALLPAGDLSNVRIVQSSGDPKLDKSVIDAIEKAAPFIVPKGSLFEQKFRTITFTFSPREQIR